jgi:hypothetical protein
MSKLKGDGKVTIGSTTTEKTVLEISSWKINKSRGTNDEGTFDSGDWMEKSYTKASWTGSCTGFTADADTTGQDVLEAAFDAGTLLTDLRFYLKHSVTAADKIAYYAADIATDTDAGVLITSYDVEKDQANETSTISFNFEGTGPLKKTTATLPES